MPLSIGLVGLPNAGKSTVFNVLIQQPLAETARYPFSTVQPHRALIEVPDPRLTVLGELTGQRRRVRARIEVIDIAGLVRGASRGEGLGNQFLHQIRECDALLHVLDCYAEETGGDVPHDSVTRLAIVRQELILSDAERLENRLVRLQREAKGNASLVDTLELMVQARDALEQGIMLRDSVVASHPAFAALNAEMGFITAKPELVLANVGEERIQDWIAGTASADRSAWNGCQVVFMCALMEEELLDMSAAEEMEFRQAYGLPASGLASVIEGCFSLLSLIRFYTLGTHEVRAWEIPRGGTAIQGAAKIHTDFVRGFIAADVVPFTVFAAMGSERQVRSEGLMRSEGRDYQIQDGDIVRFKFNL